MRTQAKVWLIIPTVLALGACGRGGRTDDRLKSDLALASQAYSPQAFISPVEQAKSPYTPYAPTRASRAAQPAPQRAPQRAPAQRTTTTRQTSAPATQSGPVYSPQPVVVKNTKRDAAIGAAAGAVIGATTSRNKVRGGLIGAAVGGILGGVVGNNVDIHRQY